MPLLFAARRPSPASLALLALAAVAVGIGGFEHARLFHRGYAEVEVVGPLFLLNAIASLVCILLLVFERPVLFVLGSLGISIGSVVSILISHNSSFFSFSESGYDPSAKLILYSEIAAIALTLLGAAGLRGRRAAEVTA